MTERDRRIAIIIPNYNGLRHLKYSIPSLVASLEGETQKARIIIVDNASDDGSTETLAHVYPDLTIIRNKRNLGFAESVNIGARWALAHQYPYIAVSNNDIQLLPSWTDAIVHKMEQEPEIGIIGFKEIGRDQLGNMEFPDQVIFNESHLDPAGCFYVCRTSIFRSVGLYDAEYFAYLEETDFFDRVRRAGVRIVDSNVPVWHFGGGTSQRMPFRIGWLSYRNAIRFAIKSQNGVAILRHIGRVFLLACAPLSTDQLIKYVMKKTVTSVSRDTSRLRQQIHRVRPSSPPINLIIFIWAIVWNILHLPETLSARKRDYSDLLRRK